MWVNQADSSSRLRRFVGLRAPRAGKNAKQVSVRVWLRAWLETRGVGRRAKSSILNFDLATFLLVLCFADTWFWRTVVFGGLLIRVEPFDRAVWTFLRGHLPPVKVASESLNETSPISLFARLPTLALLVTLTVTHARFLVLRSSPSANRLTRKRETVRSLPLCSLALKLFKKAGYITDSVRDQLTCSH